MPYVEMTKIEFSLMFPPRNVAVDNGFGSADGLCGRMREHKAAAHNTRVTA